jgi:hypothetical protein
MSLQPHVNGEVAVMLVVVGDVVHQHGTPESIGRPSANDMRNLHRLGELSVGGRRVHAIAIDKRLVQRLNEYSLVSDLLVVSGRPPATFRLRLANRRRSSRQPGDR